MGVIQPSYLIVKLVSRRGTQKLNAFIRKLPEEYRILFHRLVTPANAYVIYIMNWDGSKEGWDTSREADAIREDFIKLVKLSCHF
jgi:hypothetical protein